MELAELYNAIIFKQGYEKKYESLLNATGYISNIRIHTSPYTEVVLCISDKAIEYGVSGADGLYTFVNFTSVQYPQKLFKNLIVYGKSDLPYTITVDEYEFDVIIDSYIKFFGVCYKLAKESVYGDYLYMKGSICATNGLTEFTDTFTTEDRLDDANYIVAESWSFRDISESYAFSWIKDLIIPSIGNEYMMYAVTKLNFISGMPKIIIFKDIFYDFMEEFKKHYPKGHINIVPECASVLYNNNKKLIKKIITACTKDMSVRSMEILQTSTISRLI